MDSKRELPPLDVAALRADTPGCEQVIHFNNAGAGLMTASVLAAMTGHLTLEAQTGGYEAAAARAGRIRGFYTEAAGLLGARPEEIAFANSSTHAYATALSAIDFRSGDVILTTRDDFVSNQIAFLSLRRRFGVRVVRAPNLPEGGVDVDAMATLMRTLRPRLVAVTHVPTNSGLVQPVAAIGRHCRDQDLLYLVDACQSIGQLPLDVTAIGADLLAATCRKWLRGPRGTGLLYVSQRVLDAGYEPLFVDTNGADWVTEDRYEQVATAARFEYWEFPYATLLGCAEAIRYARTVGIEAVAARTAALGARLRDRLAAIGGVRLLDRGADLAALVTFAVDGWDAEPFKAAMDRQGINSALSLREFAILDFGDKGVDWCLRLSPHYYNTEDEVDRVADAVAALVPLGSCS
ncbi:aminotransferase class V-fold PLP-dependent enzyme [Actinoplanes sp. NBRC 101535]|uniref:aminotransferase class V-fold PLP-dependent enzyme n=1 Tax=Actinoplanes sp. NBRC 101535 TaxID=3032196 RepID=UPI0024A1F7A3|nr:aminotransferase class V-fold PLP-dependent enzyme [Actinoplanes sp. NBRC 101535]GLY06275.1 aminotransferase class V [Actinoplanes sp. NBRC 101535]